MCFLKETWRHFFILGKPQAVRVRGSSGRQFPVRLRSKWPAEKPQHERLLTWQSQCDQCGCCRGRKHHTDVQHLYKNAPPSLFAHNNVSLRLRFGKLFHWWATLGSKNWGRWSCLWTHIMLTHIMGYVQMPSWHLEMNMCDNRMCVFNTPGH